MNTSSWPIEHTLTASQECDVILKDIFEPLDSKGMNAVMQEFCEDEAIALDWELNGPELDELLIENEDHIRVLYSDYRYKQSQN